MTEKIHSGQRMHLSFNLKKKQHWIYHPISTNTSDTTTFTCLQRQTTIFLTFISDFYSQL